MKERGGRRRGVARWIASPLRVAGMAGVASAAYGAACVTARPGIAPSTLSTLAAGRLPVTDVRFGSASGSTIHGWYAPGRPGRGAVLLLHGIGSSRLAMLARAEFLHDSGFTVLLPDFQAAGASPGRRATYGALESLDAAAALAFLHAHACGERVGVIGVSMGGAAALLGGGPLGADAFVLESVYPTIHDAAADRLERWLGPVGFAGRWAAPAAVRFLDWRAGTSEAALRPIDRIAEVRVPLLVAAGTADPYTHFAETRALYERARAPKELWPVYGATHEDLHLYAGAAYERRVGGFLARTLTQTSVRVRSSGGARTVAHAAGPQPEEGAQPGRPAQCLDEGERQGEG